MSRHATQLAILGKHACFADILRYLMLGDTFATQIIVSYARFYARAVQASYVRARRVLYAHDAY